MSTTTTLAAEIDAHIRKEGSGYQHWYCGIAADPSERLFNDHNVSEGDGWWIYRDAGSSAEARTIERHFLDRGCQGAGSGGDHSTKFVYAYRITPDTRQ